MHRMVMAPKCGEVVDHINGDTLDNRRSNLRVCSNTENLRNRKGSKSKKEALPKGVFRRKSLDRFEAKIGFERRLIFLGVFDTVDAATAAYNAAALEMHGNFARLSGDAK